jgi:hypothetical protein
MDKGLDGAEISIGGESSTKTRARKKRIIKPQPRLDSLRRLEELQERIKGMEEQYLRENRIQRREEEKPPADEQEIEDYRKQWERCYGRSFGSFDAESKIFT